MPADNYYLVELVRKKARYYLDDTGRNETVLQKMLEVDRYDFLPEGAKACAYIDEALPIGFNQTCSQPSMVAFMLDKLNIQSGNRILEIGSGCGYAAAIASKLCGPDGKVWAVEIVAELVSMMKENLGSKYPNISVIHSDGSKGLQKEGPFDRIFLSAGVNRHSFDRTILVNQLTDTGILVYPEARGSIFKLIKSNDKLETTEYYGVSFVPLQGDNT